jgi:hypothetical protein
LYQLALTHPFPFSQYDDSFTDMLPWGKIPSNDVQVECVKHGPKRSQIPLPTFEQANGRHRKPNLLGKSMLGEFLVLPLSFEMTSQGRTMERKFEHSGVRERENSKIV